MRGRNSNEFHSDTLAFTESKYKWRAICPDASEISKAKFKQENVNKKNTIHLFKYLLNQRTFYRLKKIAEVCQVLNEAKFAGMKS